MIIFVIFSAILLYLSFPNHLSPNGYELFAYFFAVPLFYFLEDKKSLSRFFIGLVFSLIFYVLVLRWFYDYNPVGFVLLVLVLALPQVLFCLFCVIRSHEPIRIFYIPALWVTFEGLRPFYMRGFTWDIAHSQAFNNYMSQWGSVFGSEGLAYLLIFINGTVYALIRRSQKRWTYLLATYLALVLLFEFGKATLQREQPASNSGAIVKVCSIQPNIDPSKKYKPEFIDEIFVKQIEMSEQCLLEEAVDLVVWPETSVPADLMQQDSLRAQLVQLVQRSGTAFLIGTVTERDGKYFNSAILIDPEGLIVDSYDKRTLIPFSEYAPEGLFWEKAAQHFQVEAQPFSEGAQAGVFELRTKAGISYKIGIVICSEETQRTFIRDYVQEDVDFIVVLLNDGWFSKETGLLMHAQTGIMNAVSFGVPVIRSTNTGWSIQIGPKGRIRDQDMGTMNQERIFYYDLEFNKKETLYSGWGRFFLYACAIFVLWGLFFKGKSREL